MKIALAAAWLAAAAALGAQQPPAPAQPQPPAAAPDTTRLPPRADSAATSTAIPDSLVLHTLPDVEGRARPGSDTEVWTFERGDLLAMEGLSLGDLLEDVPGVVRLRGGDYGAPEAATAYGLAGGGIRVFWDGFEQIPLDGSVTDLSRIALGGVESVRVERRPGELRIDIESLRDHDPRVLSLVEAGTGDLGTNFFTGTFQHPRALDGSLALALDRIDTNSQRHEEGAMTGGWLRYHRFFAGDAVALTAEARRMKSGAAILGYPGEGTRLDWVVRARWEASPGVVFQGFTGRSSLHGLSRRGREDVDRDRPQHGLMADVQKGPLRVEGSWRLFGGDDDVPSHAIDVDATAELDRLGGVEGSISSEGWQGEEATLTRIGAWTRPVGGFFLFASRDSGDRGAVLQPLPADTSVADSLRVPEPDPGHRISNRSAVRFGARFARAGVDVAVSRMTLDTDSLPLLMLQMDRDGVVLPGVSRTGFEVSGRVPLPFLPPGFAVTGAFTQWDEGARYLPRQTYQAWAVFHRQYKETGNLELWGRIGFEGRTDMIVPFEVPAGSGEAKEPVVQPFYRSWHALIQVRVLTVRLFVAWENFTVERNLQDFPERVLPIFRSHYGVRWTLWN